MTVSVHVDGTRSRSVGDLADLMSRYQEHVERKVASFRETRDSYDRLLRRIAAGELDPRAFDRGLNSFLQISGPEYAGRVARLSMQFLAGILSAGGRDAAELFDAVAPGAMEDTAELPKLDPTDAATWLPQLISYADEARLAQTHALRTVLDRVANGELHPDSVEQTLVERGQQQVPASVTRLADLFFELLIGLDEANSEFGVEYLRSVERRAVRPDCIDLRGRLGESARVRLVVANDERVSEVMRCAVTDVRREDGIGPAFDADVEITPDRFELAPNSQVQVALSLLLTEVFTREVVYVGEFHVRTDTATVLEIPVRIRATEQSVA